MPVRTKPIKRTDASVLYSLRVVNIFLSTFTLIQTQKDRFAYECTLEKY